MRANMWCAAFYRPGLRGGSMCWVWGGFTVLWRAWVWWSVFHRIGRLDWLHSAVQNSTVQNTFFERLSRLQWAGQQSEKVCKLRMVTVIVHDKERVSRKRWLVNFGSKSCCSKYQHRRVRKWRWKRWQNAAQRLQSLGAHLPLWIVWNAW